MTPVMTSNMSMRMTMIMRLLLLTDSSQELGLFRG